MQARGAWRKVIDSNSNVLRRKLRSEPSGIDEQAISPVKAVRMALARASEQAFNLALRVISIRQSRLDLAEAVEKIEDDWALFPLIHDDGSVGVMCLEAACIIAFVERQTLGHVRKEAAVERQLTPTDKALAISFVEVFLRQFDEVLVDAPTAYWTRGYRPEDAVPSRHLMALQFDASEYRGFDVLSEVIGSDRSIGMRLLLPIKEKPGSRHDLIKQKGNQAQKGPTEIGKSLQKAALSANIELDAIMCKVLLPLSELEELKPGKIVRLPQNATLHAFLVDRVGRTEQSIHLGQLHGLRAVRLFQDIENERNDNEQVTDEKTLGRASPKDAVTKQSANEIKTVQLHSEEEELDELDEFTNVAEP